MSEVYTERIGGLDLSCWFSILALDLIASAYNAPHGRLGRRVWMALQQLD